MNHHFMNWLLTQTGSWFVFRVETNPHQTLTRLKNNIVFLSRAKVDFNAVRLLFASE